VVDDDSLILEAVAAYLREYGFDVIAENDSRRALKTFLQSDNIGALLCDFEMPNVSGEQLAYAAKQRVPAMPVFVVSGVAAPAMFSPPWDMWFRKGCFTLAVVVRELRKATSPD
jgi:FixJ family two-component response regulator